MSAVFGWARLLRLLGYVFVSVCLVECVMLGKYVLSLFLAAYGRCRCRLSSFLSFFFLLCCFPGGGRGAGFFFFCLQVVAQQRIGTEACLYCMIVMF